MVVRENVVGQVPKLSIFENFFENFEGADVEIELEFRVKNICVGKHLFYLVSEDGKVYQGDYTTQNIIQITKEADYIKQQELQLENSPHTTSPEPNTPPTDPTPEQPVKPQRKTKTKQVPGGLGFGFQNEPAKKRPPQA